MSLLTGENLENLQFDKTVGLKAVEVLKKYNLNVYYDETKQVSREEINIDELKNITLTVGTAEFDKLKKTGFHEKENDSEWTNGNAIIIPGNLIEVRGKLELDLKTHMPPICKDIVPKISLIGNNKQKYETIFLQKEGDTFFYSVYFDGQTSIQQIQIQSDIINAPNDQRTLSFPFVGLTLKKAD